jgi:hypothetical protein
MWAITIYTKQFQYSTAEILARCLGLIFEVQCNYFGCFSETSKNFIYSRFIKSKRRYGKRILRVICEVGDFDFGDKDSSVLGFMPCILVNTPQRFEVTKILWSFGSLWKWRNIWGYLKLKHFGCKTRRYKNHLGDLVYIGYIYIHTYMYIYVCVCVCVCIWIPIQNYLIS